MSGDRRSFDCGSAFAQDDTFVGVRSASSSGGAVEVTDRALRDGPP
jgi:hypothetical protein